MLYGRFYFLLNAREEFFLINGIESETGAHILSPSNIKWVSYVNSTVRSESEFRSLVFSLII